MSPEFDIQKLKQALNNQDVRKRLAYENPLWFSLIYLRHHIPYPLAPFHKEMGYLLVNPSYQFIVMMAFRESGKSTIMNMANVLWSVLGKPQKKFPVIVSKTQDQASNHFANLKNELLTNELLRSDFGPFTDNETDWKKKTSLELIYHGSKIMSVSLEQSIRGLKYGRIRPDLIIADDIEDISTAQDDIARDRAWQRLMSEVIPLGTTGTRIIILGNLICPDSIIMHLKEYIDNERITGIFRAYPLLDDDRRILWPGRWSNLESIVVMKKVLTASVWTREFLLKILGWDHGRDSDDIGARIGEPKKYRKQELEKIMYQKPLIAEMEPYAISVPIDKPRRGFSTDEEVDYQRYYGNVDIEEPMRTAKEILDFETSLFSRWDLIIKDHMLNATPQEEYEAKMAQAEKECEVEFKFGSSSPS